MADLVSEMAHDADEVRGLQLNNDKLNEISDLANQALWLEDAITQHEEKIKELSRLRKDIVENRLPVAMQAVGMRSFELRNGAEITLKDDVYIGMPEARRQDCLEWLRKNGFGDLIKTEVKIALGMGEDAKSGELKRFLTEAASGPFNYDEKVTVLPQTLRAWARERDRRGDQIPEDLFSVHRVTTAAIKTPKT